MKTEERLSPQELSNSIATQVSSQVSGASTDEIKAAIADALSAQKNKDLQATDRAAICDNLELPSNSNTSAIIGALHAKKLINDTERCLLDGLAEDKVLSFAKTKANDIKDEMTAKKEFKKEMVDVDKESYKEFRTQKHAKDMKEIDGSDGKFQMSKDDFDAFSKEKDMKKEQAEKDAFMKSIKQDSLPVEPSKELLRAKELLAKDSQYKFFADSITEETLKDASFTKIIANIEHSGKSQVTDSANSYAEVNDALRAHLIDVALLTPGRAV